MENNKSKADIMRDCQKMYDDIKELVDKVKKFLERDDIVLYQDDGGDSFDKIITKEEAYYWLMEEMIYDKDVRYRLGIRTKDDSLSYEKFKMKCELEEYTNAADRIRKKLESDEWKGVKESIIGNLD